MKRKLLIILSILVLLGIAVAAFVYFWPNPAKAPDQAKNTTANNSSPKPTATDFDKTTYSLSDPASQWVVVNKLRPLSPQTYVPSDLRLPDVSQRVPGVEQMKLRAEAATALETMFAAATTAGHELQITTAFRGFNYQKTLYDGYVASDGQAVADTQSARPGYSEHQTGWSVDIRPQSGECYLEACFGTMPEGEWLANNAATYGFILRYPEGKTDVTGYTYEPWHFRYVGRELAAEMKKQDIQTLEEFFGLEPAGDYAS